MTESPEPPESPSPEPGARPPTDPEAEAATVPEAPAPEPPADLPKIRIPDVPAVHGSQLVSPIQSGVGEYATSACPVCFTHSVLPSRSAGWVPLRCDSCGTEFLASDGSPPPPLPPPSKPTAAVKIATAGSRILSLILLGDGGRRLARCPACHALESVPLAGSRVEMRCQSCGTEFTAASSLIAPPPVPPAPPPRAVPPPPRAAVPAKAPAPDSGTPTTDAVRTATDGSRSVICPLCRRFSMTLPRVLPTFTITVTCTGCRRPFTVNLRRAIKKPASDVIVRKPRTHPPARSKLWAFFVGAMIVATLGALVFPVIGGLFWMFRRFLEN